MDPRFDETLANRPGPGPSNDALGARIESLMNYGTKLEKVRVTQFLGRLVVEVHEKLEMFRLLLNHIQFRS
jgi:hypothetical protein